METDRKGVAVRPALEDDLLAVMNVLDAAMLEVDARTVREGIGDGSVLVAGDGGRVLGACVVEPETGEVDGGTSARVDALAVRPRRRGQGVGSSLVVAAAARWDSLVAEFDAGLWPFYESCGFEVIDTDGHRCRALRRPDP